MAGLHINYIIWMHDLGQKLGLGSPFEGHPYLSKKPYVPRNTNMPSPTQLPPPTPIEKDAPGLALPSTIPSTVMGAALDRQMMHFLFFLVILILFFLTIFWSHIRFIERTLASTDSDSEGSENGNTGALPADRGNMAQVIEDAVKAALARFTEQLQVQLDSGRQAKKELGEVRQLLDAERDTAVQSRADHDKTLGLLEEERTAAAKAKADLQNTTHILGEERETAAEVKAELDKTVKLLEEERAAHVDSKKLHAEYHAGVVASDLAQNTTEPIKLRGLCDRQARELEKLQKLYDNKVLAYKTLSDAHATQQKTGYSVLRTDRSNRGPNAKGPARKAAPAPATVTSTPTAGPQGPGQSEPSQVRDSESPRTETSEANSPQGSQVTESPSAVDSVGLEVGEPQGMESFTGDVEATAYFPSMMDAGRRSYAEFAAARRAQSDPEEVASALAAPATVEEVESGLRSYMESSDPQHGQDESENVGATHTTPVAVDPSSSGSQTGRSTPAHGVGNPPRSIIKSPRRTRAHSPASLKPCDRKQGGPKVSFLDPIESGSIRPASKVNKVVPSSEDAYKPLRKARSSLPEEDPTPVKTTIREPTANDEDVSVTPVKPKRGRSTLKLAEHIPYTSTGSRPASSTPKPTEDALARLRQGRSAAKEKATTAPSSRTSQTVGEFIKSSKALRVPARKGVSTSGHAQVPLQDPGSSSSANKDRPVAAPAEPPTQAADPPASTARTEEVSPDDIYVSPTPEPNIADSEPAEQVPEALVPEASVAVAESSIADEDAVLATMGPEGAPETVQADAPTTQPTSVHREDTNDNTSKSISAATTEVTELAQSIPQTRPAPLANTQYTAQVTEQALEPSNPGQAPSVSASDATQDTNYNTSLSTSAVTLEAAEQLPDTASLHPSPPEVTTDAVEQASDSSNPGPEPPVIITEAPGQGKASSHPGSAPPSITNDDTSEDMDITTPEEDAILAARASRQDAEAAHPMPQSPDAMEIGCPSQMDIDDPADLVENADDSDGAGAGTDAMDVETWSEVPRDSGASAEITAQSTQQASQNINAAPEDTANQTDPNAIAYSLFPVAAKGTTISDLMEAAKSRADAILAQERRRPPDGSLETFASNMKADEDRSRARRAAGLAPFDTPLHLNFNWDGGPSANVRRPFGSENVSQAGGIDWRDDSGEAAAQRDKKPKAQRKDPPPTFDFVSGGTSTGGGQSNQSGGLSFGSSSTMPPRQPLAEQENKSTSLGLTPPSENIFNQASTYGPPSSYGQPRTYTPLHATLPSQRQDTSTNDDDDEMYTISISDSDSDWEDYHVPSSTHSSPITYGPPSPPRTYGPPSDYGPPRTYGPPSTHVQPRTDQTLHPTIPFQNTTMNDDDDEIYRLPSDSESGWEDDDGDDDDDDDDDEGPFVRRPIRNRAPRQGI